ncbi:hypothetical protein V8C35DRAFT_301682 [Trichoderma chlorosporum]
MERGKRPILPLPPGTSAPAGQAPQPKKRRVLPRAKAACDRCRARKAACDGSRPECARCVAEEVVCNYRTKDAEETLSMAKQREVDEIRDQIREYEAVIRRLCDVSAPEALASLHMLRSAPSLAVFLSETHGKPSSPPSSQSQGGISGFSAPSSVLGDSMTLLDEIQPPSNAADVHDESESQIDGSTTSLTLSGPFHTLPSHQLLEILANATPEISQTILQQLRSKSSPQAILELLQGNSITIVRPSEHETARSVTPPVQSPRELQLMVQHPASYPRLDPVNLKKPGGIPIELLLAPDVSAEQEKASSIPSTELQPTGDSTTGKLRQLEPPIVVPHLGSSHSTGFGPVKPPEYFDPRLANLDIKFWSTVPVDNSLAAEMISLHLELEYPFLGLFDIEGFISGLVQNDISLCSAFELNALLAYTSLSYTAKSPLATSLSYQFGAESMRLWHEERNKDSPTYIVGLVYLYLFYSINGKGGSIHIDCLNEILEIAGRMKLFGTVDREGANDVSALPPIIQRNMAHAAWGIYSYLTAQALFRASDPIEYPPLLPFPPMTAQGTKAEDGDSSEPTIPAAMYGSYTFFTFCQFWTIVNEVLVVYHSAGRRGEPALIFAFLKYHKLLHWVDGLPKLMERTKTSPAHVWLFHIWYHTFILEIFRPFVTPQQQHDLSSWTPSPPAPLAVFSASVKQLKHLVLIFRHDQTAAFYTVYWHAGLLSVANAVLKNSSDPKRHFYFMLCIYSYRDLAPCFPIFKQIAQGLLAIATECGLVKSAEATRLLDQFNLQRRRGVEEQFRGDFVLDLDLAVSDKERAKLETLMEKFDGMKVLSEQEEDAA